MGVATPVASNSQAETQSSQVSSQAMSQGSFGSPNSQDESQFHFSIPKPNQPVTIRTPAHHSHRRPANQPLVIPTDVPPYTEVNLIMNKLKDIEMCFDKFRSSVSSYSTDIQALNGEIKQCGSQVSSSLVDQKEALQQLISKARIELEAQSRLFQEDFKSDVTSIMCTTSTSLKLMRQKLDTIEEKLVDLDSQWKQERQQLLSSLEKQVSLHQASVTAKLESLIQLFQDKLNERATKEEQISQESLDLLKSLEQRQESWNLEMKTSINSLQQQVTEIPKQPIILPPQKEPTESSVQITSKEIISITSTTRMLIQPPEDMVSLGAIDEWWETDFIKPNKRKYTPRRSIRRRKSRTTQ